MSNYRHGLSIAGRVLLGVGLIMTAVLLLPRINVSANSNLLDSIGINDPEVTSLAADKKISIEEARERIAWQVQAMTLEPKLLNSLGHKTFGGIWIGQDGRIKVGLVRNTSPNEYSLAQKTVARESENLGVKGQLDLVDSKFSLTELMDSINSTIDEQEKVNSESKWPISLGLKPSLNAIIVGLPKNQENLTEPQQAYLQKIGEDMGDKIVTSTYSEAPSLAACDTLRYCDDPLRGGIGITGSNDYTARICTAGFTVIGDSGQRYMLTAGHCNKAGHGFGSKSSHGTLKKIGPNHRNILEDGGNVDGMIIKISPEYGRTSRGWVFIRDGVGLGGYGPPSRNETYEITDSGVSAGLEGQRVCLSGSTTGSSCGPVISVNVSHTFDAPGFPGGTLHLVSLVQAELCGDDGDSGGPVTFQGNALGTFTGFTPPKCGEENWYTGFRAVRREMDGTIQVVTE